MNELPTLLNNLSLGKILTGLNKTLNFVNQAIPLYQQIKPILNNSKDLLNIINNINKEDNTPKETIKEEIKKVSSNNLPTFFQ